MLSVKEIPSDFISHLVVVRFSFISLKLSRCLQERLLAPVEHIVLIVATHFLMSSLPLQHTVFQNIE